MLSSHTYIDWDAVKHIAREIGEFLIAVVVVMLLLIIAAVIIVPLVLVLMSESGT